MKKASKFEKVAARCWNILNEGKPFTPVFVVGVFLLFHLASWGSAGFWMAFPMALGFTLPLLMIYFLYDYPLHLRWFLWIPTLAAGFMWYQEGMSSVLWLAVGLYFFFTVIFWGTIYYHLRIGTTLWNFTRFWKLVLKNSDTTSGNAQEQIPKVLMLLLALEAAYRHVTGTGEPQSVLTYAVFAVGLLVYTYLVHRLLFTWKPVPIAEYTPKVLPEQPLADKVYIVVIDGCNKDRLAIADTPFIDWLKATGTEYTNMETVYPARTVVCFSSMFTGTYSFEHGIKSNMVYKSGINCESIFDSLRTIGKSGSMLAVAHLVDAFGNKDVRTYTAVTKNDVVDRQILERAREIVEEEDPDLFIVQLISTDQTGHSRGVFYDEYLHKINEADQLVASYYEWLKERGKLENAAFIVCADHGQSDGIGGHGHLDEGERYVPFIMHGPMIKQGVRVDEWHSLVSVAPTISYLMKAPYPNKSRGTVLHDALQSDQKDEREEA
ncbi:alkaline phosphatase family protein [Brevibacillus dissolubilis]|uniref:alkaline phosphatase family protein n=1 Tax=Brevibacillus dissolubilis TaxID=1844116 RepID=UPI0011174948|nr:alkaline phosphatase family protein [Brevibacillus dissolubilis]